jgi:hypothetical protein
VAALRGAAAALRKDVLLCYEDHGADRTSSVTKFVLEELRFRVFFVDDQGCTQQISRLTDLEKIKTDRKYGYNFFGCRDDSAFFTALNSKFAEL